MNIFYEEDGSFKVGNIMTDNTSSLQVENLHGKRCKIKAANVMLRFAQPGLSEFMQQAEQAANDIDLDFLWEACPPEEFAFEELAQDYYGHTPTPVEAAGALIRLHGSPMHFYKKGKGRYKAAPADALKAALASVEKKRLQAELQARYTDELTHFKLPAEFADKLKAILYQPDRNTLEVKALEAACAATHLSVPHLLDFLERCRRHGIRVGLGWPEAMSPFYYSPEAVAKFFEVTGIHTAFEAVREEANTLGVEVSGSEAVGLVPLAALTAAGRFYAAREGLNPAGDRDLVDLAAARLGLSDFNSFDPKEKVIEFATGR